MTGTDTHTLIEAAADGRLPGWARVLPDRRTHLGAVADLLGRWAVELGLGPRDALRWRAAGWLHDALRDEDPEALAEEAADFPERVRHGPAVAAHLREAGVEDEELLEAVSYHSLGKPGLRALGRYLYLADYLEPGRRFDPQGSADLRARLPGGQLEVLRIVCARRIADVLERRLQLRSETVGFWNELVGTS